MTVSRRKAREHALQLLYAYEVSQNPIEDILQESTVIMEDGSPFDPFTVELVKKSIECKESCAQLIKKHARNWEIHRIALLDKLILRIAMTEFLHISEIPPKVTINEALEIAKTFSTGKSVRFINGILNAVHEELVSDRSLHSSNG